MTLVPTDPVALTQALVRCESVTPDEGGALTLLQNILEPAGSTCHRLIFTEPGTPDVDNLYARLGSGRPHLSFAGHTDVVPAGDEAAWTVPPFAGEIRDGLLYGRGAVDMKGCIAAFVAAALKYIHHYGGLPRGSLSFLITGDEEGPSINGTMKMLEPSGTKSGSAGVALSMSNWSSTASRDIRPIRRSPTIRCRSLPASSIAWRRQSSMRERQISSRPTCR